MPLCIFFLVSREILISFVCIFHKLNRMRSFFPYQPSFNPTQPLLEILRGMKAILASFLSMKQPFKYRSKLFHADIPHWILRADSNYHGEKVITSLWNVKRDLFEFSPQKLFYISRNVHVMNKSRQIYVFFCTLQKVLMKIFWLIFCSFIMNNNFFHALYIL